MPLPVNVSTGVVTGTILNADGGPAVGTVLRFDPGPDRLLDGSANVVVILTQTNVRVDPLTGSFSVTLIATDDIDLIPINWTYSVTILNPATGGQHSFNMGVAGGSTVDLASIPDVAGSIGTIDIFASIAETIAGTITTKPVHPAGVSASLPFFDVRRRYDGDIAAAYAAAKAANGGTVFLDAGTYLYAVDQIWDDNEVLVHGVGTDAVTLQAQGSSKVIARSDPFTIVKAPSYTGFTVKGDPAIPAGAVGIYTGDITGSTWDIVVEGFAGVGAVGVDIDNARAVAQTERNRFGFRLVNNAIGVRCRRSSVDPAMLSFGYNTWRLQFDINNDQIGWLTQDNVVIYHGSIDLLANVSDAGVVVDVTGTSQVVWNHSHVRGEQTFGVDGIGLRVADGARWYNIGFHDWLGTMEDDNQNTLTAGGTVGPTLRDLAGVARTGNQYMAEDGGILVDFIGTDDAQMIPVLAESTESAYSSIGFLSGPGIVSPYMSCYAGAGNGIVFLAVPFGGTLGEGTVIGRLGSDGKFYNVTIDGGTP